MVIATGGLSYPSYRVYRGTDTVCKGGRPHGDTAVTGACPVRVCEDDVKELQGLSLRNIEVTVWNGKKVLWKEFGEMLFTHFGVSGPSF